MPVIKEMKVSLAARPPEDGMDKRTLGGDQENTEKERQSCDAPRSGDDTLILYLPGTVWREFVLVHQPLWMGVTT